MLKKEVRSHLLITLIWLGLITFLRWSWHWSLVLFWLGGVIGAFFLDIDHLLYALVIYPHELTSMRVKRLIKLKSLLISRSLLLFSCFLFLLA